MILTDAGPMVALLNRKDPHHARCLAVTKRLATELVSTLPCVTEAMYLLFGAGGFPAQAALWTLLRTKRLRIHELDAAALIRMQVLMEKYKDTPMDFADASLIAAAEQLGARQVFSIDSDFLVYRLIDDSALELIPSRA